MGVVGKYRERQVYFQVKAELIEAARFRGTITYKDIAFLMGLPLTGNHMQVETGRILGEISEDEVNSARPMLSAIAVNQRGDPGSGFYELAEYLQLLKPGADTKRF